MSAIVVWLPPAPFWTNQGAYEIAFGSTWRIAAASLAAFVCGEFVNSFVLAKMKILTGGRWLWTRTIGSTIFGERCRLAAVLPPGVLGKRPDTRRQAPADHAGPVHHQGRGGSGIHPITYGVVGWLKRAEHEDYYDTQTDFNPFTLKT